MIIKFEWGVDGSGTVETDTGTVLFQTIPEDVKDIFAVVSGEPGMALFDSGDLMWNVVSGTLLVWWVGDEAGSDDMKKATVDLAPLTDAQRRIVDEYARQMDAIDQQIARLMDKQMRIHDSYDEYAAYTERYKSRCGGEGCLSIGRYYQYKSRLKQLSDEWDRLFVQYDEEAEEYDAWVAFELANRDEIDYLEKRLAL